MAARVVPVPPAELSGRLVFGDVEQIKALRQYEDVVNAYTKGDLVEWKVTVEIEASRTFKVSARSKIEAEELGEDLSTRLIDSADVCVFAERVE